MVQLRKSLFFTISMILTCLGSSAQALPGQSTDEATAWINANPTLRPSLGEGLVVKKSETPAHRFQFQASVLPPGRIGLPRNRTMIRSEQFSFYDMVNGVTAQRLSESLRNIYGVSVYQDFQQAAVIYQYPTQEMIRRSRQQNLPLLAARKGQLLLGDNYAYWMEVVETDQGVAFSGHMTVFLQEDLDKFEQELRAH